jgi:transcriptional regulator with XRE-family HTH domain
MTQRELARRLEVDKSVISNYCCGKILPKLSELIEIAKIFEVSLDYLVGIEKIPAESIGKSLTEIGFSEKTTKALKQLDEADKALIEKVLMHGLISGLSYKTNRKESE